MPYCNLLEIVLTYFRFLTWCNVVEGTSTPGLQGEEISTVSRGVAVYLPHVSYARQNLAMSRGLSYQSRDSCPINAINEVAVITFHTVQFSLKKCHQNSCWDKTSVILLLSAICSSGVELRQDADWPSFSHSNSRRTRWKCICVRSLLAEKKKLVRS